MLEALRRVKGVNWLIESAQTPLLRNAYALVINTGATSGLGFLFWFAAARLYPEDLVGINSAAITTMILIASLAGLNMQSALTRFIPAMGARAGQLILIAYGVTATLAALAAVGFVYGQAAWSQQVSFLQFGPGFVGWFALSSAVWVLFVLQDSALVGLRAAMWVPLENILFGLAKLLLVVVFIALIPRFGLFAAWTIPVMISLIPINWLIFRRLLPRHAASTPTQLALPRRDILRYIAADYIGQLFALGSSALLPLIILERIGTDANAFFQIAWTIGYTPALMATGMTQSLTVEGAANPDQLRNYIIRIGRQVLLFIVPLVAVLAVGGPWILAIFGRSYSEEGTVLFQLLALSSIPVSFSVLAISIARVLRRMGLIIATAGLSCALSLGFTFYLTGPFGLTGVGIAYLASQILVALSFPLLILYVSLKPASADAAPTTP